MRKVILAISFLFFANYICIAQGDPQKKFNRIEALKIAYITRELNLTPDESQKFWPIYNSYFDEIKTARQANANDEIAFEEKVLSIRKKYRADFNKVLVNDQRTNKIFTIERNYQEMLRKELMNRQKRKGAKQDN